MSGVKALGSTREVHLKLGDLSMGEGSGIPGVAVKCVDQEEHRWRRRLPGPILTLRREGVGSKQD